MKKKTRGNGSGSISFLKDGRNKPYIVFESAKFEIDDDGKVHKKQKRLGSFATRKEAENCLAIYNMDKEEQIEYYKGIKSLSEVYNECINHIKSLDPNKDLTNYSKCWKKLDPVKELKITNIQFNQLQAIVDLQTPATGKQVKTLINLIYKFAIKMNYTTNNLADIIETKKVIKQRNRIEFNNEEIEYLWSMLYSESKADKKHSRFLLTLLYSGMRLNELVNMKTDNVFLNENYMIGGSKTENGINRIIPIHHKIKSIIEYYLNTTQNNYLIGGDFKTLNVHTITGAINGYMENFGFKNKHSSHDCRTTFLTQSYRQRLDWVMIEKITGHSIKNIGLNVYVKFTNDDLIKEVNKIDYSVSNLLEIE